MARLPAKLEEKIPVIPLNSPIKSFSAAVLALTAVVATSGVVADTTKTWSLAEFGEPLYDESMPHWPYVNPDAPKGGSIVLSAFGTFDSLNTYILKGEYPRSLGLITDVLMTGSANELASAYGLLAESAEYPDDKSWVIFNLRPQATFNDGSPITARDFKFSFDTIRTHGRPFLKSFYDDVDSVEVLSDHRIKFSFKTTNNMKPLMKVAGMSPESVAYWKDKDISKTFLTPPPSSGPYEISTVEAGRSITYERVKNYWGENLNVSKGINNIDKIRYDYYADLEVMVEAFKAGEVDYRAENSSKRWATAYEIDQVKEGKILLETPPDNQPQGIQAFFFNLRRNPFDDQRVRKALGLLYDFETTKRTILYNQYDRIDSYFVNSEYGASGVPTADELAVLEPYRDQLDARVLEEAYTLPVTDGSGRNRSQVREAIKLFKEAGWNLEDGKMMKDGKQLQIEMLLVQPDGQRVNAIFMQNMKKIGIDAEFRVVDSAQYQNRIDDREFDIITVRLNFFPPPGPELRSYYGSAAADERGSANMAGIKNDVVDELIEKIISAPTLEQLQINTRALDRVLLWNDYVLPQFYNSNYRLAFWNRFGQPRTRPKYGTGFPTTWWIDKDLDAKLDLKR